MSNYIPPQSSADLAGYQVLVEDRHNHRADRPAGPMPDLQTVLRALAPLPSGSALLGVCDDGLPLLLDLKNPAPGSVLLVGDLLPSVRNLLRNILASISLLHRPDEVDLHLVAARREGYQGLLDVPGSVTFHSPYDPRLPDVIHYFASRANQRQSGRQRARLAVLGIEDLEAVASQLSEARLGELAWLADCGPREGSWVFAGLNARRSIQVDPVLFQAFHTCLAGFSRDLEVLEALSDLPAAVCSSLDPGVGYCVNFAGELIRFWLPRYTTAVQPENRLVKGV